MPAAVVGGLPAPQTQFPWRSDTLSTSDLHPQAQPVVGVILLPPPTFLLWSWWAVAKAVMCVSPLPPNRPRGDHRRPCLVVVVVVVALVVLGAARSPGVSTSTCPYPPPPLHTLPATRDVAVPPVLEEVPQATRSRPRLKRSSKRPRQRTGSETLNRTSSVCARGLARAWAHSSSPSPEAHRRC